MITIKKKMTDKEKCDLIESTLPRFFGTFNKDQSLIKISRETYGKNFPRECVVLTSTNGEFNAYWMRELIQSYILFVADGKIYIESVRNLNLICTAL